MFRIQALKEHLKPGSEFRQRIRSNFLFALYTGSVLIVIETAYRVSKGSLRSLMLPREYIDIFFILFVFSFFIYKRFVLIFIYGLLVFSLVQMVHYSYYGTWVLPAELFLFFPKHTEVFATFRTIVGMLILPALLVIPAFVLVTAAHRKTGERIVSKYMSVFIILFLLLPVVRVAFFNKKLGTKPNEDKSIQKNTVYTAAYFTARTLPCLVFDIHTVRRWEHEEYPVLDTGSTDASVVLIIGESLTCSHMSLFGYERKTTGFLDSLKNRSSFIYKKALSAGVYTDSSLPHILNIVARPDATLHIMSRKTNLFRMAREQGFRTYFITAQSRDSYSYLRSYLSRNDIDVYKDSFDFGFDAFTYAHDHVLLQELETMDFGRKNFIVLNMAGSHSPYSGRIPDGFSPFPVKNIVDEYDTTVAYTDHIMSEIVRILSRAGGNTYIIFSSDHGQNVGLSGCGHGNINEPSHYEVPFFIHSIQGDIENDVRGFLGTGEWTCHYDIARITAFYLGYRSLEQERSCKRKVYVNGPELNGNSGYMEILLGETGIEKRRLH